MRAHSIGSYLELTADIDTYNYVIQQVTNMLATKGVFSISKDKIVRVIDIVKPAGSVDDKVIPDIVNKIVEEEGITPNVMEAKMMESKQEETLKMKAEYLDTILAYYLLVREIDMDNYIKAVKLICESIPTNKRSEYPADSVKAANAHLGVYLNNLGIEALDFFK